MATVTVDSTSQRYTSRVAQDPDILLLHTTEGMSWPGYNGGGTAPHDTVKAIPGKGIEVRRHYPYDQFSKSLENDAGGVETNKRGVIQVELRGTCDPKHRNDPAWYFWPDADDAVLEALADYYRPIMAKYSIPVRAMAEFVAYPKSYGATPTRLTFAEWMNGSGICGHQHAPENAHGDPGAFPIARFLQFLKSAAAPAGSGGTTPKPPTLPTPKPTTALVVDGKLGPATIKRWQKVMGTEADGVISRPSELIRAVQRRLNPSARLVVDGKFGPATIRALQRHLGTEPDGVISHPSEAVRALQRRLNLNRF